jgi:hypothetical protein
MASVESGLVAERLRRLVGGATANLESAARNLGISELALRRSVDDSAPHPALEVMVAVVRYYGIDPTWLLTGEYDWARHRAALGEDESPSAAQIAKLITDAAAPVDSLDSVPPTLSS